MLLVLLVTGTIRAVPVAWARDEIPDIELLEMLGELGELEELGIDVDHMIEERLESLSGDERVESEK